MPQDPQNMEKAEMCECSVGGGSKKEADVGKYNMGEGTLL